MPTTAESMRTPDICSAMSTASATASAARSISTTAPLRTPLDATTPTPRTRRPVLSRSAAAQQTLVVPISSANTRRGRVTVSVSECSRRGCAIQGFFGAKPQDAGFASPVCHNMLVVFGRRSTRQRRPDTLRGCVCGSSRLPALRKGARSAGGVSPQAGEDALDDQAHKNVVDRIAREPTPEIERSPQGCGDRDEIDVLGNLPSASCSLQGRLQRSCVRTLQPAVHLGNLWVTFCGVDDWRE